jgi:hypothetical protein
MEGNQKALQSPALAFRFAPLVPP